MKELDAGQDGMTGPGNERVGRCADRAIAGVERRIALSL